MNERGPLRRIAGSDAARIWSIAIAVSAIGFLIAWRYVGSPPPKQLAIAAGAQGGGYWEEAVALRAELAEAGIELTLVETAGSVENLELIGEGRVALALVQGGVAGEEDREVARGIAALYLEPLWLATRAPVERLEDLRGLRVELGAPGSGTRALVEALMAEAGVGPSELALAGENGAAEAIDGLAAGGVDAIFLVGAPRSEPVRRLLAAGEPVRIVELARARGIARHLTYLEPVRLARGAVDLERDLPATDLELLAPAATLIASADLHHSVVALVVEAAKRRFAGRGVLREPGELPNLALLDVPPSDAARRAMSEGPSFLYRVLPFQVAAVLDRLKILALPLVTLLLPLVRMAPPLYRWRIRRRILVWYKRVIGLEQKLRATDASPAERAQAAAELDRFDAELANTEVPLGYADELFHLRAHLRMVREDLSSGRGRWGL